MKKSGVPTFAWMLVGLLVIAAGLMSLGEQDVDASPEAQSYTPSGVSAFVQLLKKSGTPVMVSQLSNPKLAPNDVEVAFQIIGDPESNYEVAQKHEKTFQDHFWENIKRGGSGIVLPLKRDFLTASQSTKQTPFEVVTESSTGKSLKITDSGIKPHEGYEVPGDESSMVHIGLWQDKFGSYLDAYRVEKGTVLVVRDGIGITNRFIDKNDNAKAFGRIISMLATPGKRVVFTEASFGNVHDLGLLETIGSWANAAWQQLLLLGIVVVFTLGKRFGLPEEQRPSQRGVRELLDAVADTYRRAQSTQAALATAYFAADNDLRLFLKLPKDAPRTDRDRFLPVSLQNALARLQVSSEYPAVTQDQALNLIIEAQKELEAFLGPNRAKLRSLAKLRA